MADGALRWALAVLLLAAMLGAAALAFVFAAGPPDTRAPGRAGSDAPDSA